MSVCAKRGRKVYTVRELRRAGREAAIEWGKEHGYGYDNDRDGEMISEDFKHTLEEKYGFRGVEVGWSLNGCQGDCVAFCGTFYVDEVAEKDEVLAAEIKRVELLAMLTVEGFERLSFSAKVEHYGNYYHNCSMQVQLLMDVETQDGAMRSVPAQLAELEHWAENHINERVKEISSELADDGEKQIEWLNGDERVFDALEANDVAFYFNGERAND